MIQINQYRSREPVDTTADHSSSLSNIMISSATSSAEKSASFLVGSSSSLSSSSFAAVTSTKAKKRVTFSTTARQRRHLHINDYTDDEYFATWYTSSEYTAIKDGMTTTIRLMRLAGDRFGDSKQLSSRGLERYLNAKEIYRTRNSITRAVLREQDLQRRCNDPDPHAIAAIYGQLSQKASATALQYGKKDAKAAYPRRHHESGRGGSRRNLLLKRQGSSQSLLSLGDSFRNLLKRRSSKKLQRHHHDPREPLIVIGQAAPKPQYSLPA
mmetsp:Transcript_21794/g.62052  ORF Transcript_21794/g.62052 Transcript_21794/m.62052 type:complete len:269 (-) Transcript_21794:202-1008(-)